MSKHTGLMIGAGAFAVGFLLFFGFGATWLVIHGVMELGQYAGVYDWEPTWLVSAFATLIVNIAHGVLGRSS